ncbi:MAG TPA: LytTR family DNA-binding domain-containing protein [Cyclobacteriaceae bacterium]|nr:LytTR family DNA-binding domain-containing protein [Cyclobacteriaceae bacterium]
MSKIKCIIVEDEPLARQILEGYISKVPFLDLQGSFEDAIVAMDHLRNHSVDLIFLDIHLPEIKGIAFLKTLTNPPAVIITTAYHEYALEGYELNAIDYLLKPFEFERFLTAVNKIKKDKLPEQPPADSTKDYLLINVQLKKVKIYFSEILFIESQKEYVKIITADNSYVTRMSTHEIEGLLPVSLFQRIHRSFIIAIDKVRSFNSEAVEISGNKIPVGRGYKHVLEKL